MPKNTELLPVSILGTGSFLPDKVLTNADLEKMVDTTDEWITTRTGIKERRILDNPELASSDLGAEAAKRALAMAGCTGADVDLIICSTITPDYMYPATACLIQQKIGAGHCPGFDVEIACSGFVYGLTIGAQFVATGAYKRVLVVGVEVNSRITNWQDRNTCVIFGDGAAAVLLGPGAEGGEVLSSYLGSDGSGRDFIIQPAGGSRTPTTHETVDKKLHLIHVEGRETFKFAVKVMGEAAMEALKRADLENADLFIPHQANIRIIEASAKRINLPMEKVVVNIDKYGNTVAASVGIALDEALRQGRIHKGNTTLLVAFGAGLSWGSSCIRWNKLPTGIGQA